MTKYDDGYQASAADLNIEGMRPAINAQNRKRTCGRHLPFRGRRIVTPCQRCCAAPQQR